MFAEDRLPPDNVCVECGSETSDILQCSVECERPRAKGRGYWSTVVLGMLAPFWFLISLSHDYKNAEVFGEDLIVQTPLPLCPTCAAAIQPRKKDLHNLLRRVPLYDQLLQEYPHADADIRQ
ncbi:MAG: hypothetical protein KDB14_03570 [Planctomycetales bacterium]|nr:hypothetical protein [Planctomycetales bacterium]